MENNSKNDSPLPECKVISLKEKKLRKKYKVFFDILNKVTSLFKPKRTKSGRQYNKDRNNRNIH